MLIWAVKTTLLSSPGHTSRSTVVVGQSLNHVWFLCDLIDCSPSGSSVHEIFQARIREWMAISFSRGSTWLRDQLWVSYTDKWVLYQWTTWFLGFQDSLLKTRMALRLMDGWLPSALAKAISLLWQEDRPVDSHPSATLVGQLCWASWAFFCASRWAWPVAGWSRSCHHFLEIQEQEPRP